jgi:hypothetical protein
VVISRGKLNDQPLACLLVCSRETHQLDND